jgi:alkylhydroperoxidase family enzyme
MKENAPRLPLRSSADTEGDTKRVLGKLEETGNTWTLLRMLANSPHAFRPRVLLADALLNHSAIPRTITETAILRCAVLVDGQYEWEQHEVLAKQHGVSNNAIRAIADGDLLSSALSLAQRLAVRFCDELVTRRRITDETWSEAQAEWGTEGVCDLLITVAYWAGFTSLIAAALELDAGD